MHISSGPSAHKGNEVRVPDDPCDEYGPFTMVQIVPQDRPTSVFVKECIFESNQASGQGGAAVISMVDKEVVFEGCTLRNNTAYMGGALLLSTVCDLKINHTMFEGNTAQVSGGAVTLFDVATGMACRSIKDASNKADDVGQFWYQRVGPKLVG